MSHLANRLNTHTQVLLEKVYTVQLVSTSSNCTHTDSKITYPLGFFFTYSLAHTHSRPAMPRSLSLSSTPSLCDLNRRATATIYFYGAECGVSWRRSYGAKVTKHVFSWSVRYIRFFIEESAGYVNSIYLYANRLHDPTAIRTQLVPPLMLDFLPTYLEHVKKMDKIWISDRLSNN